MKARKAPKRGKRTPIGERKQFLTMMHPDTIEEIKQAAIIEHRAAWNVMEEAAGFGSKGEGKGAKKESSVAEN
jgi:hypothetical protein